MYQIASFMSGIGAGEVKLASSAFLNYVGQHVPVICAYHATFMEWSDTTMTCSVLISFHHHYHCNVVMSKYISRCHSYTTRME